ncbi:MAG: radical SAM protein [Candidatus Saganbacteria bacterium]|nr:radical SAM protein [Candidatus Saganbacteria bacterium]
MSIKKQKSDQFYAKMHGLARKEKFPLKAMFELTYKCNFRCIHCYICPDRKKKELTTKQVKQVLDQLKGAGCFHVGFTGGEIFLRKDIFEILDYAKVNGFRITLLTNGYLVDKKIARRIASLGTSLNRVDVSVLGATEETFEKITRKKGSFKRVMNAIRYMKDEGIDVQIKATLMKANKDEFLMIKKLAEKFDTMFRYGPSISPKVDGDVSTVVLCGVDPEELYQIKKKLASRPKVVNERDVEGWDPKRVGKKPLFRCGAGQTEVSISPYGEMNFCLEIHYPEYNILKGSFKKGWEKMRALVENWKPDKNYLCNDCVLAGFCHWCPAKGGIFRGERVNCSQPDKETALVEAKHSPFWAKIAPCLVPGSLEKPFSV